MLSVRLLVTHRLTAKFWRSQKLKGAFLTVRAWGLVLLNPTFFQGQLESIFLLYSLLAFRRGSLVFDEVLS